ncbi:MAG: pullulanase-type alpha-1,6-glucosidase [Acidobacteria bacterium]|nr:pullulanase-type alpha-1,6-glucosidase [Acidobacteriota bacterium]
MFFVYDSVTHILTIGAAGGPKGNLALARAHWVDRATIAWNIAPVAGASYLLHSAPDGGLTLTSEGVAGGETIPLALDPAGLPDAVKARFPHLAAYAALKLPADQLDRVPELLKGQLAISASAADGTPLDATSLQLPGVIDDLYTYDGPLGIAWRAGKAPTLRVWAPTARSMRLLLFDDSDPASPGTAIAMQHDPASGVWTVEGERGWNGKFYLYELTVFVRQTGRVEVNQVTDPYSISLSLNGRRSQIVDLDDPALKPPGWDGVAKPKLAAPTDVVLYELHVRDFSANDASVPPPLRGTFQAFAARGSAGSRHLAALAQAGVSHVHLLPAFDFATVEEDKSLWQQPAGDLASYPPDSDQQQAAVMAVADRDPYNWGYDPFHYMVPEGSYATDPDGPARIREFRAMVQALNRAGLRVVMDVVFNHTSAAGQDEKSVLDRLVPGYYHRLNADGMIENSTCCQNTATEHAMMEKLMLDALVLWAKAYKVDGFRFDLMGHHMLSNMVKVRDTLHALTIPRDGVDGSQIYLYGEAWNFGEVANEARGVNATQLNIGGLGIGSFNDRGRDGARGGGPFAPLRDQGYLTGLALDPNGTPQGSADEQLARLLHQKDWIRAMLAGNLRDYELVDAAGNRVPASQIDYNGQPAGYTLRPEESINYVSAHDNETLFDAVQLKAAADATLADRVRMHNLGLSLLGLGQGVPFFHAGDELLRSKSMDRDSYNSGDWFNKIDWSYDSDNWGVGLPPAEKNSANWPLMQPLLADPELKPGPAEIRRTLEHFLEINAIRRSSHLFRLPAADEIMAKLRFHNTGPGQLPGLIVMSLAENTGDAWGTCGAGSPGRRAAKKIRALDYDFAVVLFNADKDAVSFADPAFAGLRLALHPVQLGSNDPLLRASAFDSASGTFTIPPRTASVFVCSGDGPLAYKTKHRRQK